MQEDSERALSPGILSQESHSSSEFHVHIDCYPEAREKWVSSEEQLGDMRPEIQSSPPDTFEERQLISSSAA